jgi:glucose-6-phosphate isomerase
MSNEPLTLKPQWIELLTHAKALSGIRMTDLFKEDLARSKSFFLDFDDLSFDFSKNKITENTIALLSDLARACKLEESRDALFAGAIVNRSENKAALHPALRGSCPPHLTQNNKPVWEAVNNTLSRLENFVSRIQKRPEITDIVTLGIGGSTIGPQLVCEALKPCDLNKYKMHFLCNIDPYSLEALLKTIKPENTIFIIASKTFGTQETLANAHAIREYARASPLGKNWNNNFCAVTANTKVALDFGLNENSIFDMPDWVGGRFSLWSAIGLPIALSVGFENFKALLDGAAAADKHFLNAPLTRNIPVIMALLGVWYRNFFHYNAHCILPYSDQLSHLPRYIQQLDMESNGKSVDQSGESIPYKTAPVVFGEVGTNAQHAFLQMLHQGTDIIPSDFIGIRQSANQRQDHQDMLIANLMGQSRALMEGRKNTDHPHRHFDGNRPSNILWLERLTPYSLGKLLAFYEHKAATQGIIWNINSFDQWGVELGKDLAIETQKTGAPL